MKQESRFNSSAKEDIRKAALERRLYIWHSNSTEQNCDRCGKANPGVILSVCSSTEAVLSDPMSGEIFLFGSKCYQAVEKELGLKNYRNLEEG